MASENMPGNLRHWAEHGSEMEARCAARIFDRAAAMNGVGHSPDICLAYVRAVIDELRTPTDGMIVAAELAPASMVIPRGRDPSSVSVRQNIARLIYLAALNAASPPVTHGQ